MVFLLLIINLENSYLSRKQCGLEPFMLDLNLSVASFVVSVFCFSFIFVYLWRNMRKSGQDVLE